MNGTVDLKPVDKVEITTLYENLVDANALGQETVRRLSAEGGGNIVSKLLADERRVPFVGGHGLSMLVRVTRDGITRLCVHLAKSTLKKHGGVSFNCS